MYRGWMFGLVVGAMFGTPSAYAEIAPCNSATVAYWRFDGDYTDSCGTIDGTPAGSPSIDTSNCAPLSGNSGCLVLIGSPSRLDLPAPFNPTHTGPLPTGTFEVWVYFDWTGTGDYTGVILNHGVAASSTDLNVAVRAHDGGGYSAAFSAALVTYPDVPLPGFAPTTWHHLAWTWDGTTITTYLDGDEVGSQAGSTSVSFTGNEAEIGSDDQEVAYWVGRLDETRLSDRVLAPSEFLLSTTIPTVSEWGLATMVLVLLAAGTVVFTRRRRQIAA